MEHHINALVGVISVAGEIGGFIFLCFFVYALIEKAVESRRPKGRLIPLEPSVHRPKLYVVNRTPQRDAG
jgi:hypothetical protein